MLLSELRTATRALIGDKLREDPAAPGTFLQGATTWTDPEIKDALNWAQQRYCEETRATLKEASITCTNGIGHLSDGAMSVHAASSGGALDRTTLEYEEERDPLWRTNGTTPKRWMPWGDHGVRLSPSVTAAAQVVYTGSPTPLALDADTPDPAIPAGHHQYLPIAAASYLFSHAGDKNDPARAGALLGAFYDMIGHPKTPPQGN